MRREGKKPRRAFMWSNGPGSQLVLTGLAGPPNEKNIMLKATKVSVTGLRWTGTETPQSYLTPL